MNHWRKRIHCCVLLAIVIIGIVVSFGISEKPDVGFSFLGYKTELDGTMTAMFELRNLTVKPRFSVGLLPPQISAEHGWKWSKPPVAQFKTVLTTNEVWTVGFPAPSLSETWRVAMIVRSEKSDLLQERIYRFLARHLNLRSDQEILGRYSFSEPIPPPIGLYRHYRLPETQPEPPSPWE